MKVIDLNQDWILSNKKKGISLITSVPSTVFETLIEQNEIGDPFYGLNEQKVRWVYESNWMYEKEFHIDHQFLKNSDILLRFNGLDTFAEIYVNGIFLGRTKNMFKKYDFNGKKVLKNGKNLIKILFRSPTKYAKEQIKIHKDELTTGESSVALPGAPYIRKAQYQFGWDWGPKLPDIGIWKPVELIGYNEMRIESIHIKIHFDLGLNTENLNKNQIFKKIQQSGVKLIILIEIGSDKMNFDPSKYKLRIYLKDKMGKEILSEIVGISKRDPKLKVNLKNAHLWWTHDLGDPYLYTLKVILLVGKEVIDRKEQKIGLRDVQLIRNKDKWGESFYFQLNGIPLFAKGANWIPIDSFIPRGKKLGLYERNIKDAKASNMNMIRVWGGGIYEDDVFYDLCDKMGLLVWQDFPFACAIYPYHRKFIENVKLEAIHNIKRLRNHPSLALWCGNNEIEYLWRILLINSDIKDSEKKYQKGYVKLFENILPRLVEKYDPKRPYWPSSPSNGFCNENLGKINSNSPKKGDSHYWGVWHGGKSFSSYRRFNSRFMSEFGFESFPSIRTIRSFCPSEDFEVNSEIMENHQKNPDGNDKILKYMKKRFNIPESFRKKIILSQITQAEAIEYGVKHWRSKRKDFHCMGSFYWQLNDCWPVVSWSSIDYFGRWKALHYIAKRFYKNIIGCVFEKRGTIKLYIINDTLDSAELLFKYDIVNTKGEPIIQKTLDTKVSPTSSKLVEKETIEALNIQKKNTILLYKVIHKNKKSVIDFGYHLFENPKEYDLYDPKLDISVKSFKQDIKTLQLKFIIRSKRVSLFTFIYSDFVDFIASDNYFSMESNEVKFILITIEKNQRKWGSIEKVQSSFHVRSLYDLTLK
jgi:beta-mannosidase